jgi:hypothetical protein
VRSFGRCANYTCSDFDCAVFSKLPLSSPLLQRSAHFGSEPQAPHEVLRNLFFKGQSGILVSTNMHFKQECSGLDETYILSFKPVATTVEQAESEECFIGTFWPRGVCR